MKQENYAMLCDFYEFTMSNGYFRNGFYQKTVYFDVFFRDIPDGGGFAIAAGLEQVIDYVKELHFTEEDIAFLHELLEQGFQLKGSSQAEIDACHARLASDNGGQA